MGIVCITHHLVQGRAEMSKPIVGLLVVGVALLTVLIVGCSDEPSPTPLDTPVPSPTFAAAPTATGTPAATPMAATATPAPTPMATPTANPTDTPTPEHTVTPSATATATPAPAPTATPTPEVPVDRPAQAKRGYSSDDGVLSPYVKPGEIDGAELVPKVPPHDFSPSHRVEFMCNSGT